MYVFTMHRPLEPRGGWVGRWCLVYFLSVSGRSIYFDNCKGHGLSVLAEVVCGYCLNIYFLSPSFFFFSLSL